MGGRWGQPLCVLTTGGLLEACQVGQDEVPGGAGQGVFPKAGVDEVGEAGGADVLAGGRQLGEAVAPRQLGAARMLAHKGGLACDQLP